MLVLCQRLETRIEQRAAQATLKGEQVVKKAEKMDNPPEKTNAENKNFYEDFSDEDDSFITDLEEREVNISFKLMK